MVFHAATALEGDIVTNGGRVLGVTALGDTFAQAIDRAYQGVRPHRLAGHAIPAGYWGESAVMSDVGCRMSDHHGRRLT